MTVPSTPDALLYISAGLWLLCLGCAVYSAVAANKRERTRR